MKRLIIISWEFPGHNTRGGTAVSKRVGSLAYGLSDFERIVIARNHFTKELRRANGLHLIPGRDLKPRQNPFIFRKFFTFLFSLIIGDRSGFWGILVYRYVSGNFKLCENDIILTMFTPRGPVLAGFLLKRRFNCKWVIDFQDTFDEGLGRNLFFAGRIWFKRIIKNANACVHVSPEWSIRDGQYLSKKFETIRHSLPDMPYLRVNKMRRTRGHSVKFLYYGSLDANHQFHPFFFDFIKEGSHQFKYAGLDTVDNLFSSLDLGASYRYLGWLAMDKICEEMEAIDFALIFSYTLATRMVVPSKLYEMIACRFPFIVIGEDTGGIQNLEREFNFKFLKARNSDELARVLDMTSPKAPDYSAFNTLSQDSFIRRYNTLLGQL